MDIPVDSFFMDPDFTGTLQQQVQRMVSDGIVSGRFLPGDKLPSSRGLARHLGVSRITVTLALTELVAADYLTARGRSGYYVSQSAPRQAAFDTAAPDETGPGLDWSAVLTQPFAGHPLLDKPANWHDYPYPFIYGQADEALFDHANWRLCALQALGRRAFRTVASDSFERDDPELVKYIARHTLPRRNITAGPDEILITMGAQHALWLCTQLLLGPRRTAAMEEPGYPGLRALLRMSGCRVADLRVDEAGLDPDAVAAGTDVVFATPSHQCPTNATMPVEDRLRLLERARAHGSIIVEDDYEFEIAQGSSPAPALKSLDRQGRVVYVGSFSKSLFPGLRLGYLVGAAPFIREARALRTAMMRHPPGHLQRTVANFLSLGHYDALVARIAQAFRVRRAAAASAIAAHGLEIAGAAAPGGSSFWMRAPHGIDTGELARRLAARGVLIEPGGPFFSDPERGRRYYRLAYSSIPAERIAAGIAILAEEIARG